MPLRRRPRRAALVVLAAAAAAALTGSLLAAPASAVPAPSPTAAAGSEGSGPAVVITHPTASCGSLNDPAYLNASGSLASVWANYYYGFDSFYGVISNTWTDVIHCQNETPKIGDRFYVRVKTGISQPNGVAPAIYQALRLPPGVYPAIDANNPITCISRRASDNYTEAAPNCPTGAFGDVTVGGGWSQGYPWNTGWTIGTGYGQVPAGWFYETYIPVFSTKPLNGLGSASSDFLWGGVYTQAVGPVPNSGYGYSYAPAFVNDRNPVPGFPATPVTGLSSTGATLQGQVLNYWKAGTALIEYGKTTSYGSQTANDAIPGNDPSFPGYTMDARTLTGLTPSTTYHYRVKFTQTSNGLSYYSADRTFSTLAGAPTAPGAPTGVSATPSNASAQVSWSAPGSNGGSAVTGYTVTSSPGAKTCTTTGALACSVGGLSNGTSYTFTVRATNGVGTGPVSAASAAVTPRTTPGAPTGVSAQAGNGAALVSWAPPASNGGAAISGYTVTSNPGGKTCTTTGALSCTVPTLANGTAYTFTVRAANVAGQGPASAASGAVTPKDVPNPPQSPSAVAGNASATVKWAAPASNGGSPVTGYLVTSSPGGRTCTTTGALTCVVTGLTNGVGYTFTVRATSAGGTSLPSAATAKVTPSTVPGKVRTLRAAFPRAKVTTVTWLAPASNGGAALVRYDVRLKRASTTRWGAWTSTRLVRARTFAGLLKGVPYDVQVRAVNARGAGLPLALRFKPTK